MKRLNQIALLLCACCFHLFSSAQTATCSADFSYAVKYVNTVAFFAKDSLGATHHWNFGDGTGVTVTANGEQTHQFLKPGKYEVKHFIEKPNVGCRDSAVKIITVEWTDTCSAAFNFQKTPGSLSYQFSNYPLSYTGIKEYSWSFGDGTVSGDHNPAHTFKPGTYTVCLKIVSNNGCISSYCEKLQVIDSANTCAISARFSYINDSIDCKKVYFQNTSGTIFPNVHFIWKFGDGSSSNDISPAHVYAQPGKYYVCLVAEAGSNCRKEYCDSVIVKCENTCSVAARFEWKKDSSDCKKIRFINYPEPVTPTTRFAWMFGDGNGSDDANPSHTYQQPGRYQVCLVVNAGNNCSKYYCDSVTVRCEDVCNIQPSFTWKRTDSAAYRIYFINNTTASLVAVHYAWKFGDNTSSNDSNPVHVYTQPGKYTVCLVVETNNCRKEICQQIEIKSCNITAGFEKQSDAEKWNTVYFSNASKPINAVWQTYWTYGDETSSRDYNSFHNYDKPGVYNVCLKVISLNGCISNYCDTIRIAKKDSCTVSAKFGHYTPSTGVATKLEALYYSSSAVYYWNFGDSTIGTGRITEHLYSKPGRYNVCLTVKNGLCTTTFCETIVVQNPANAGRIAIFPNPAVNNITVDVNLERASPLSVRFLDGGGAVRAEFNKTGNAGSNRFILSVDKLNQGLYIVEIKGNSSTWFSRFIKSY